MKKCNCLSAPQYHRDECLEFDTFGNKKGAPSVSKISRITWEDIEKKKPSPSNPVFLISQEQIDKKKTPNSVIGFLYPPEIKIVGLGLVNNTYFAKTELTILPRIFFFKDEKSSEYFLEGYDSFK